MKITFYGTYGPGAGRFAKEIVLPSPVEELSHIHGWPDTFKPGTFNIHVDESRWPQVNGLNFQSQGVKCLDRNELFKPIAYLDYSVVPENTLRPQQHGEFAGDLQFWRSVLKITGVADELRCYMLRRVKSGYKNKIEVVSDINFKEQYQLEHGIDVELGVYCGAP